MTKDKKLISLQPWERWWIRIRYGVSKDDIQDCISRVGKGRKKVYDCLRNKGYKI